MKIITQLEDMQSGECRWIEREDIHAYCRHPLTRTVDAEGRVGWRRDVETARYCVVCPAAGRRHGEQWLTVDEAAIVIGRITLEETRT